MARVRPIDDDRAGFDCMEQVLRLEGHEFACAADGTEGLALVQQFHPDLAICDVVMPHLGDYAVFKTVRANRQMSSIPVLLFSTFMDEEARSIAWHGGATEVLARPFDMEQLRAAVGRCLWQEA